MPRRTTRASGAAGPAPSRGEPRRGVTLDGRSPSHRGEEPYGRDRIFSNDWRGCPGSVAAGAVGEDRILGVGTATDGSGECTQYPGKRSGPPRELSPGAESVDEDHPDRVDVVLLVWRGGEGDLSVAVSRATTVLPAGKVSVAAVPETGGGRARATG
ncbi:DUF3052 family protein [Rhodococcus opacus]|uniref:DUF3052 family protein n=1 Tax=Rhodococcus opacus TaxID=37919 RepID=UPI003975BA5D